MQLIKEILKIRPNHNVEEENRLSISIEKF